MICEAKSPEEEVELVFVVLVVFVVFVVDGVVV
jgi:hypothetical protein